MLFCTALLLSFLPCSIMAAERGFSRDPQDSGELHNSGLQTGLSLEDSELGSGTDRDGKLFFSTIRYLPKSCEANMNNLTVQAVCLLPLECEQRGGEEADSCAGGMAVCCILTKTCDENTNNNHTFFINPDFPLQETEENMGACSLTVIRMKPDVCQIRLDFLELELAQPDENGECIEDFLTITGGITKAPTICGSNTGQHLYVHLDSGGNSVRITVDRALASTEIRRWNIKVSQISCASQYSVPRGCLQHFTSTSGIVRSFNFDPFIKERSEPLSTRQIANMDYGVCIRLAEGYCSIMWSADPDSGIYSFTVSETVDAMDPMLIGTPSASTAGKNCTTDYVIIPGGTDDTGVGCDRYCGIGFPNAVISFMKPFMLFVKTDGTESGDTLNRGFALRYRQAIC